MILYRIFFFGFSVGGQKLLSFSSSCLASGTHFHFELTTNGKEKKKKGLRQKFWLSFILPKTEKNIFKAKQSETPPLSNFHPRHKQFEINPTVNHRSISGRDLLKPRSLGGFFFCFKNYFHKGS